MLLLMYFLPWIILAPFYLYFFYVLSFPSFLLNAILITVLYILIKKDVHNPNNQKYYFFGALVTAFCLILSATNVGAYFLLATEKLLLSKLTITLFLVYGFAHVIALVYEFYLYKSGKGLHEHEHEPTKEEEEEEKKKKMEGIEQQVTE